MTALDLKFEPGLKWGYNVLVTMLNSQILLPGSLLSIFVLVLPKWPESIPAALQAEALHAAKAQLCPFLSLRLQDLL